MDSRRKLAVLADAARLDAPCAGRGKGGDGRAAPLLPTDVEPAAIYESVAADGRRVPLLRLLLSNHCVHDCAYCPLRRSADPERARLGVREVVRLTLDWHRRGLVEGLFLSSAVDRDADHTMEQLVAVARTLRCEHHFLGYIHLKVIPFLGGMGVSVQVRPDRVHSLAACSTRHQPVGCIQRARSASYG